MELVDALSGRAGAEGIRWLLVGDGPQYALERALSGMLSTSETLGACHLRAARFRVKPDVRLSATYDVEVLSNGRSEKKTRAVAVTWKPKWVGAPAGQPRPESIDMEAEAQSRGVAAPFRQLSAREPAWGMRIQVSPLDARFPQLVRASDPEYVRQMLSSGCTSGDDLQGEACSYAVSSVRYSPGHRHVLRYDSTHEDYRPIFAKCYKGEQGRRIFQVVTRVAEWFAANGDGLGCLKPAVYIPDDSVILYPLASGTPLHEFLPRGDRRTGRHLERVGQALSLLHQAPKTLTGKLESYSFDAEIAEVEEACDYMPALSPSMGATIQAVIDRARELYERLPQEAPALTHCDFKAEHAWVTPRRLTFIDFDSSRLSDPALDVGNFLADLTFWHDNRKHTGLSQTQERFLAGYASRAPSQRLERARPWEALELVRMAGRRVPLFSRDWAARTERLVSRAETLLNDLHEGRSETGKHPLPHTSSRNFINRGTKCVQQ